MWIINNRNIFFFLSATLVVIGAVALVQFGVRLGIDFTGGSLMEVQFQEEEPPRQEIQEALAPAVGNVEVQRGEGGTFLLRFRDVSEEEHQQALEALEGAGAFEELRFDAVGPSIGEELKRSAATAIGLGLLAILFYIMWAFRGSSHTVRSWQYSTITVLVAVFHDVLLPLGAFALLGRYFGVEVNTPFVAAMLTVLGYSVNDTIVVFDRVRENLRRMAGEPFANIVGTSLTQTFVRSLNTSLTLIFAVGAVWYFGGEAVQAFAIAMALGVAAGTYSSLFVAAPALVVLHNRFRRS